jgi:hypothetical protein
MTFSGRIVPVNRFGMKKNETGVLAKSSFEETSKVMFEAAVGAEYDTMRGVSANIMFGQKPPCGTGFVTFWSTSPSFPRAPRARKAQTPRTSTRPTRLCRQRMLASAGLRT